MRLKRLEQHKETNSGLLRLTVLAVVILVIPIANLWEIRPTLYRYIVQLDTGEVELSKKESNTKNETATATFSMSPIITTRNITRGKHRRPSTPEECLEGTHEWRLPNVLSPKESFCPKTWPLPHHPTGCCEAQTGSMEYTPSTNNSSPWCQQNQEWLRDFGSSLLAGKKLLFVGDSVGQNWLNAMLLDANSRHPGELLPLDPNNWKRYYQGNKHVAAKYNFNETKGFCEFPFETLGFSTNRNYIQVTSANYPNYICPHPSHKELHQKCCPPNRFQYNHQTSFLVAPIAFELQQNHYDIVILQMGAHYRTYTLQHTNNAAVRTAAGAGLDELLPLFQTYALRHRRSIVLFLESLPQHFDTFDGSYAALGLTVNASRSECFPLGMNHKRQDKHKTGGLGVHRLNAIAKEILRHSNNNQWHNHNVRWLSSNAHAFDVRHDGHDNARNFPQFKDCTHYCYSPNLWQPAIDPFYKALADWFGKDETYIKKSIDGKQQRKQNQTKQKQPTILM